LKNKKIDSIIPLEQEVIKKELEDPEYNYRIYESVINFSSNNKYLLNTNYKTVFAESQLIISDYSSAIFDFLYLRKPIIYTHFDKEEFFANHIYTQGYLDYEENGFGPVKYTIDDTVDEIIEYMKTNCQIKEKYLNRINNFFAYDDANNCKRTYEEILKLK